MICKNCGKEIPDETRFCGYCGAKVNNEEEKKAEESEKVIFEEILPEEPAAVDVTVPDEAAAEPAGKEEPEEKEKPAEPEEVIAEETSADPEPAAESQEEIMDAEISEEMIPNDTKKSNKVQVFLQNLLIWIREHVHKEDFIPLLDSLKHPETHTVYTVQSVAAVFVVTLILNWIAFHGFVKGVCTELIMIFCALAVQFADDVRGFSLQEAVRRTAEMMEIPALLIFAACLFTRSEADHLQYMIFVILAAVRYVTGCGKLAERSRYGYLHMFFVAAALIGAGVLTGLI